MSGRALILFLTFLGAAGLMHRQNRPEPTPARSTFDRFPSQIGEWTGRSLPPIDDETLAVLGVDDYLNRAYFGADRAAVTLYVGFYNSQRQGDAIHSPLNCLPGTGWEPLSRSRITIPVAGPMGPANIDANRYVIQKGLTRLLAIYWYQSHGRTVASEYWRKFFQIRDAVRLNRTDAALVRFIAPIETTLDAGESRAESQAIDFVKAAFPLLGDYIPS
jgi:EpsI family protein